MIALVALAGLAAGCSSSSLSAPPASMGIVQNRPVPDTTLIDQHGRTTSLAAFRGRTVVMAPFLTLCQEECPLVTGAFLSLRRDVEQAGLGHKVAFVEATVDPWRDSPARLAAYAKRTGSTWTLLTGSVSTMKVFWHHFYVYFARVPEGNPPDIDWWTGRPLTFDVDHSDGFILINPSGHERFITVEAPNLKGHLSPTLKRLLSDQGLKNLYHQVSQSWTVPQALQAISWAVGRQIPAAS